MRTMTILAASLGVAMAVTSKVLSPLDMGRAAAVTPRRHFQGETYAHASVALNRQLESIGDLPTRPCDDFSIKELEGIIAVLDASRSGELSEVYNSNEDNRRLLSFNDVTSSWDSERSALEALKDHHLFEHFEILARDSKCTEAVLRYAHHTSEATREELHQFLGDFPLLPVFHHHKSTYEHELGADVHTRYRRVQEALDCHLVVGGAGGPECPGGDIAFCLANCPGVPDATDGNANDVCRETCEGYCPEQAFHGDAGMPVVDLFRTNNDTSRPPPPFWGESWQVIMSRNSTSATGEDQGFRACIRYYDWTRFALRSDCTRNGVTTISLHVNEKLYQIFTSPNAFCITSDIGITPVAPYWLQNDNEYIGEEIVRDVLVDVFDKVEGPGGDAHLYKVARSDGRPVQMLTTGPNGDSNQKDYVNYVRKPLDPAIFAVPANCRADSAREVSAAELLSHPEAAFDM